MDTNKNMRILIGKKKRFLLKDISRDFHSNFGTIKKEDLEKKDCIIKTNKDKEFYITEPNFMDKFNKIKRKPQIIPLKDVGLIITKTGIGKNSIIVDAGTGSGALSCMLANIVKKVYSYDIREDHLEVGKFNKEYLGLTNLKIEKRNIYEGIPKKDVDLVTLDVPSPWDAVDSAYNALKPNGFLVSYSPTIPQVMDFVEKAKEKFMIEETIEIIERQWEIRGRVVRPSTYQLNHSGFLTFARKIDASENKED